MNVERKISMMPWQILVFASVVIIIQIMVTWLSAKDYEVSYEKLLPPNNTLSYRLSSLDSLSLATHLLTLKIQLHDNQKGRHMDYQRVSYPLLAKWLLQLQAMNSNSEYSALLATRIFSNTKDKKQLKLILETVIKLFSLNPEKNWRWMAEGSVIAKYHLKDLNLALTMSRGLANQPKNILIPAWAKDLEFIMLEEMNMLDAAIYIVEKSLQDQSDMHPDEKRFLKQRLLVLKQKTVEISTQKQ